MPRLAAPLLVLVLAAVLAAGCGSATEENSTGGGGERTPAAPIGATAKSCETAAVDAAGLRVSGVSCEVGRQVMYGWQRAGSCALPAGASRGGCDSGSYRCASLRSARGVAVSCARPERSVAFLARRR